MLGTSAGYHSRRATTATYYGQTLMLFYNYCILKAQDFCVYLKFPIQSIPYILGCIQIESLLSRM